MNVCIVCHIKSSTFCTLEPSTSNVKCDAKKYLLKKLGQQQCSSVFRSM